ncbi:MAG: hypothetical protein IJ874_05315 [Ruminococcus sp.]|nr:hypothetical protein [Ruminococcus sp.]
MKNIIKAAAVLLTAVMLTGCGQTEQESSSKAARNDGLSMEEMNKPKEERFSSIQGESEYDIDLTVLSSSMVYAQVYDMMSSPTEYEGKTVKMHGNFSYYKDPANGNEYFAVLIADAAACCSQGIEFVLDGSYVYPDDYPAEGDEVTVTGVFGWYKEDYATYCQLTGAEMER